MKIAQIAPFWFDVPPKNYGGTERIVSSITEELIKRGHEVTLFAAPGSITEAKLVSPVKQELLNSIKSYNDSNFNDINTWVNAMVFSKAKEFDVIHSHASYFPFYFCDFVDRPVIHTIHNQLPRERELENEIYKQYRHLNFVSISNEFRTHFDLNFIATIYNGLNVNDFAFSQEGGDYLLWVGRAKKSKGELDAIKLAEESGEKLQLCMSVRPDAEGYIEKEIKPHLNDKITLATNVEFEETIKFYRGAKAFIFPVEWREPFGLIMIEAMSCGTPVIAYNRGSVSEIVKDGETGFIVDPESGINGLKQALDKLNNLTETDYLAMREKCRKRVEENFTIEKMVDGYEAVYKKVIEGHSLPK